MGQKLICREKEVTTIMSLSQVTHNLLKIRLQVLRYNKVLRPTEKHLVGICRKATIEITHIE